MSFKGFFGSFLYWVGLIAFWGSIGLFSALCYLHFDFVKSAVTEVFSPATTSVQADTNNEEIDKLSKSITEESLENSPEISSNN